MKKINITITGALGRMGRALIKRISKSKNLNLFSLTDVKSGKKVNGVRIQSNNLEAFKKTDIINDYSKHKDTIEILKYTNRLSDYLFVLGRYVGFLKNIPEVSWKPRM